VDFNKLCVDLHRVQRVFKDPKYVEMIGFEMNFKILFTPLEKNKLHGIVNLKSKIQRRVE
jgi:hypothetical protein